MVHEKHGYHFCYTDAEYKDCLNNGWRDFKEPEKPKKPEKVQVKPKRKRGRPRLNEVK